MAGYDAPPMPDRPLTLADLESDLWGCAQILRGSAIDRTDWKGWILPLLFFKRISDVWDEETAEAPGRCHRVPTGRVWRIIGSPCRRWASSERYPNS